MRKPNTLKKRLKSGGGCIGTWSIIPSATAANVMAVAGLDFVIIDMEHGPASFETAEDMVRAIEGESRTPLIRVSNNDRFMILRALETGAHGIVVPNIETAEQAQDAVSAIKYAPFGSRGMSPFTRASGYNAVGQKDRIKNENEEIMVVLMVEGKEGIKNIDAIANVLGIDVIFIGPYDLSQALGIPDQVNAPAVVKEIEDVTKKINNKGIASGTLAQNIDDIKKWQKSGVQFITYLVDCAILHQACSSIISQFKR
ncbi:MAG: aldolase [Parcubacteria group bacterium]|nr:aldolase [Parcubacteria group bacterium]